MLIDLAKPPDTTPSLATPQMLPLPAKPKPAKSVTRFWRWFGVTMGILSLLLGMLLITHHVPTDLNDTDAVYLERIFPGYATYGANLSEQPFAVQLDYVRSAQHSVLAAAPINQGLPYNNPRGPKELYQAGYGFCYDRSWNIERFLEAAGLKYRHVSVFAVQEGHSILSTWVTKQNPSHALTEVLTAKGWMLVGSNNAWLGLTADSQLISISQIKARGLAPAAFLADAGMAPNPVFAGKITYLYGLYSRHGRFFPPYNAVPDYNLGQLLYNFD
jgi:hypothetical protein